MEEITKETVTTQEEITGPVLNNPTGKESTPIMATQVKTAATSSETIEYLVYFFFGTLDILLAFRLVLKLMGASLSSTFVSFIYGLTGLFISPFEGIFRRGISQGIETTSILEPATVVAIIVYSFLAWGIVKLIRILSGTQQQAN
jgi:hypothetical protein